MENVRREHKRQLAKNEELTANNRELRRQVQALHRDSGEQVELAKIIADPTLQPRESMSEATIDEYNRAVNNGDPLPPIVIFLHQENGEKYWLADGFHRREAYRRAGHPKILAEVREGGRRAALLFAAGANSTHGLSRTDDDRRRQILILLRDDEWREWSDREFARHAHVSHPTVAKYRQEVDAEWKARRSLESVTSEAASEADPSLSKVDSEERAIESAEKPTVRTYRTRHGTTAKMRVGGIGKSKPRDQSISPENTEEASAPDSSILGQLKSLWKQATRKEQEAFRNWLAQQ